MKNKKAWIKELKRQKKEFGIGKKFEEEILVEIASFIIEPTEEKKKYLSPIFDFPEILQSYLMTKAVEVAQNYRILKAVM